MFVSVVFFLNFAQRTFCSPENFKSLSIMAVKRTWKGWQNYSEYLFIRRRPSRQSRKQNLVSRAIVPDMFA